MKQEDLSRSKRPMEIYLNFRVFNLGQENVGLRIYLDRATMEPKENFEPGNSSVFASSVTKPAIAPMPPSFTSKST